MIYNVCDVARLCIDYYKTFCVTLKIRLRRRGGIAGGGDKSIFLYCDVHKYRICHLC